MIIISLHCTTIFIHCEHFFHRHFVFISLAHSFVCNCHHDLYITNLIREKKYSYTKCETILYMLCFIRLIHLHTYRDLKNILVWLSTLSHSSFFSPPHFLRLEKLTLRSLFLKGRRPPPPLPRKKLSNIFLFLFRWMYKRMPTSLKRVFDMEMENFAFEHEKVAVYSFLFYYHVFPHYLYFSENKETSIPCILWRKQMVGYSVHCWVFCFRGLTYYFSYNGSRYGRGGI